MTHQPHDDHHQGATSSSGEPRPKVTDHFFVRRGGFEHCAYSWRVESERTYCERPYEEHAGSRPVTTTTDHDDTQQQAGQ